MLPGNSSLKPTEVLASKVSCVACCICLRDFIPMSNIFTLSGDGLYKFFFFSLALQPPWALASHFQSHDHFTDGRTSWTSYLNTGQHKHRIKTYTYQTSMPSVGFEPTIPASERTKRVPLGYRDRRIIRVVQ
jgi:hypothetical protein